MNPKSRNFPARQRLASALALALTLPFATAFAQSSEDDAPEAESTQSDADEQKLETITVTGSRIPRTELETATPVVVIDSVQIEREGFTTIHEALSTLTQATGSVQNEQFGGFTQNANAVDLRGLGPGRVLTLINGRRMADYPLPYNGQSNIVNLGAIPAVAVERIEVLAGGASAIYGSDAVAGVINIILKKDVTGHNFSARVDGTDAGGGATKRAQAAGGFDLGEVHFVYAAEYLKRDPIWAYQREQIDSLEDDPTLAGPVINTRSILLQDLLDPDGENYVDPGANGCAAVPELEYSFRPGRGYFCGRPDDVSQFTIRNADDNLSLYVGADHDFGNGISAFASAGYWKSEGWANFATPFWFSNINGGGPYFDAELGSLVLAQRIFTFDEIGGNQANANFFDETSLDLSFGLRGYFADAIGWEASYTHSGYDTVKHQRYFDAAAIESYFLGAAQGDIDGFPIHTINTDRLYAAMTPEIYRSLTVNSRDDADSSSDQLSLSFTGEFGQLAGGPIGFAAVIEAGSQDYRINLDPRLVNGDYWGFTGTGGGGERDRYAIGGEVSMPLADNLRLSLAGRYDQYDDITIVDGAATYNVGIEYRPIESVLIRGSYATSFRAPDMHFVFADPSGFFANVDDEYLCRRDEAGVPINDCTNAGVNIAGTRVGNAALKEEEGESFTVGMVWAPTSALSMTLDYYDISLEEVVGDFSLATILEREAECRLGVDENGNVVDANSGRCRDAVARVTRRPADGTALAEAILSIGTGPINRAVLTNVGVDASAAYRIETASMGDFRFDLGWSHVLDQEFSEFAGDPLVDLRDDLSQQQLDFRSRIRGSVSWAVSDWEFTVFGKRYGSVGSFDETYRIRPWITYNTTVSYQFAENFGLTLGVDNVLDQDPPADPTYAAYPYFSIFNYDIYGREAFLQLDWKL